MALVCFSHGKDSAPKATKISALSEVARSAGHHSLSVDYRGIDDPQTRVDKLEKTLQSPDYRSAELVLVGSSMGAYVSLFASTHFKPVGLYLMAPAVFMPGYEQVPKAPEACLTQIVHGWSDEIVPVENAIRFGQENNAETLLLDDDHRLSHSLPVLESHFAAFLARLSI
ncbi:alpha/beta hydrolase [Aliikangiella marina]|uniref:Alpha/beta hydrolase n=1 Tax=Aliikangiella marina TaxID=1712262 RepID=A0A545TD61_9GAMM|nr:YqiA/YcfP family alpha/beta fold hydrolase [Aliikangiella marina]TQV75157.1 alpha/beta hydrolase [Aliikangiella marina]